MRVGAGACMGSIVIAPGGAMMGAGKVRVRVLVRLGSLLLIRVQIFTYIRAKILMRV